MKKSEVEEDILRALRRITRAIDLHSRHLANTFGLTGPQLVCLRAVGIRENTTPSELAKEVSLSQATITGIMDRLAARQLITRERTSKDRRLVTMSITDAGQALIDQAPSPLQVHFVQELSKLSPAEQLTIRTTLNRVVQMMGGEDIEADPMLSTSSSAISAEDLKDVMEPHQAMNLSDPPAELTGQAIRPILPKKGQSRSTVKKRDAPNRPKKRVSS